MTVSSVSSSSSSPPQQRFLRRAANLLNSNGQPIPALQDALPQDDHPNALRHRQRNSTIGGSIKRTFRSARKRLRRLSAPGGSTISLPTIIRHARSTSEVADTCTELVRSRSTADNYKYNTDKYPPSLTSLAMTDSTIHHEYASPISDQSSLDFTVPPLLLLGTPMTKVWGKKMKKVIVRLDPDLGQIFYESKKHRIIPIENIKELRSGSDARYYRQQFQLAPEFEERWITIIYVMEVGYKTLHLLALSKDVFQMWDITLRKMYAIRQQLMSGVGNIEMRQAVWEKQYWKSADNEQDRKLDFDDVEKMCHRLNINPSRDDLLRRFKTADVHSRGYLDFADFRRFVKALKTRPELDRLYKKLCSGNEGLFDFSVFEAFMLENQKSSLSTVELQRLFVKFISPPEEIPTSTEHHALYSIPSPDAEVSTPPAPVKWETGRWKVKNFTAFLLSTDNSPFSDQHGQVVMDMTRPLSEYYISSSHNTYLVGNQLVGYSTVEGYIRALLHSCRSVELDIYDGDSEPMIYHGRTLTSKVSVREVCEAIIKYAFVASPYPIIISAEIHCGLAQQDMLAVIMVEVFGDALVSAPVDGRPKIEELPSPEDLKGRVLLKAKNLYVSESEAMRSKEVLIEPISSEGTTSSYETDVISEVKQDLKHELKKVGQVFNRVTHRRSSSSNSQTRPQPSPASGTFLRVSNDAEKPKVKMSCGLLALLVYTVGVKCRGINKKETYAPEHVFSLSESTANKLLKEGMTDLMKHNRTHVVRIYPKGVRFSSSNYEPHRYWSAGAQLVALNWQTCDLGIMINHAMFQRNGRAGYVLKPLALREVDKHLMSLRTMHFLKVTIVSAQQLPRPKDSSGREIEKGVIDPYVEVSLHVPDWTHSPFLPEEASVEYSPASGASGVEATSARTVSHRTSVVKNNGFNPIWEESFSLPFDCVGDMRDLVFVKFEVKQENKDDGEPLALYVISLGSLLQGYRHLPLSDSQLSQYLFSTLFVYTEVVDA